MVANEGGWQGQDNILGDKSWWEGLFVIPMEIFPLWFEKYPCKIPKDHGLGVSNF